MSAGEQFTDTAFLNACADMLPEESSALQDRLFVYFFDTNMVESPFDLLISTYSKIKIF
ncbi:MAG: hypothetical protein H6925_01875 [Holosporaceae bacterium]|nr:MAG: hypothetical protein H6925_01875 [Holosporaceae bacterium]